VVFKKNLFCSKLIMLTFLLTFIEGNTESKDSVEGPTENNVQETVPSPSSTWMGVGLGSGVFVLLFISLLIVLIGRRRKTRKR